MTQLTSRLIDDCPFNSKASKQGRLTTKIIAAFIIWLSTSASVLAIDIHWNVNKTITWNNKSTNYNLYIITGIVLMNYLVLWERKSTLLVLLRDRRSVGTANAKQLAHTFTFFDSSIYSDEKTELLVHLKVHLILWQCVALHSFHPLGIKPVPVELLFHGQTKLSGSTSIKPVYEELDSASVFRFESWHKVDLQCLLCLRC